MIRRSKEAHSVASGDRVQPIRCVASVVVDPSFCISCESHCTSLPSIAKALIGLSRRGSPGCRVVTKKSYSPPHVREESHGFFIWVLLELGIDLDDK
jgi:hypothetical protein